MVVGRLKRVSVAKMEALMLEGVNVASALAADRDTGQTCQAREEIPALDRGAASSASSISISI